MRDATLPLNYEDALVEIERLKVKLDATNARWAQAVLDKNAALKLEEAYKELRSAVRELCDSGYDGPFMGERVDRLFKARWGVE